MNIEDYAVDTAGGNKPLFTMVIQNISNWILPMAASHYLP
jgi:hypothetical protein